MAIPPEESLAEDPSLAQEAHGERRIFIVALTASDELPTRGPSAHELGLEDAWARLDAERARWRVAASPGREGLVRLDGGRRPPLAELKARLIRALQSTHPVASLEAHPSASVTLVASYLLPPPHDTQQWRRKTWDLLRRWRGFADQGWDASPSDAVRRMSILEAENAVLKEQLQEASDAPVRKHLEAGRVTEARQLVRLLLDVSPSSRLAQWARMLALPTARSEAQAGERDGSHPREWLRAHAKEYAGQWVALREGALLGADVSRVALHRRLQQSGALEGSLFMRL